MRAHRRAAEVCQRAFWCVVDLVLFQAALCVSRSVDHAPQLLAELLPVAATVGPVGTAVSSAGAAEHAAGCYEAGGAW